MQEFRCERGLVLEICLSFHLDRVHHRCRRQQKILQGIVHVLVTTLQGNDLVPVMIRLQMMRNYPMVLDRVMMSARDLNLVTIHQNRTEVDHKMDVLFGDDRSPDLCLRGVNVQNLVTDPRDRLVMTHRP